jgi:diguanylate cyclase (GGDEF)-like protein/PAS domain S-box-containing protein
LLGLSLLLVTALYWRARRERRLRVTLEELQQERETALKSLPVGFYTLLESGASGPPFSVELMTERALDLFGVTRPMVEAEALAAFTHLHPDDRDWLFEYNEKVRLAGERFQAEARFVVDGRQRWLRIESWPNAEAEATRWFGYVADVTDQHEAESSFKTLFEQSPMAIVIHDPETGAVLEANRAAWEVLGYGSLQALQQAPLWDDPPYSRTEAMAVIRAAAAGQRQRIEWKTKNADGKTVSLLMNLMPIVISGQLRVFATAIDITPLKSAKERFEAIFQKSPIAAFVQDAQTGEVLVANEHAAKTYGYSSIDTFLSDPASLVSDGEYGWDEAQRRFKEAVAKGGDRFIWKSRHSSGRDIWMDVALTPVDLDGRACMLAACADVTAEREAAQKLQASESRFRSILQDIDGVAVQGYRLDGSVVYWNKASKELYGYTEEEARKSTLFDLIIPERMREEVRANVAAVGDGGDIPNGELELQRKDGSLVPVYSSHTVLRVPGAEPELFCVDIDLTERKAHEEALDRMANYDSLTGLPNRRLMGDLIEQMMARVERNQDTFALCYIDLDDFKPINDQHGHDVGDQVLVAVAQRLRRLVRGSDLVSRLGGDEFVVALDGIGEGPELDRRLEFLLEGLARPIQVDRLELQVHASVGVTLYPTDSADPDTLLRHADQAMYRAKSQGRNRYSLFDVELEANVKRHRERLVEIERGLEEDQFRLHYQPKIDLSTGEVASLEGLVRWHLPDGEVRSPMAFLPDLDRTTLEARFGQAMIAQALSQASQWAKDSLDLSVSVNISGPHLLGQGFVESLAQLLAQHPTCRPEQLVLEIVESAAVHDLERAIRVLNEVRQLGVQVSLDDFGTGYSSLSHLRSLPVDEVKVDQTFVRDMLDDISDRNIVQSVISLAAAFSLRVVAEGVETQAHADALREMGCQLGQGYVFAKPMPADQVRGWLVSQSSTSS